jgi:uncharacterized protein YbjT (DUF2867 family)
MTDLQPVDPVVLVTGATGYVGGRLIAALVRGGGCTVRCLARTPAKLEAAPWRDQVDVAQGSVGDDDLSQALSGVDVAVYLVHSIGQGSAWQQEERDHATNFATQAKAAGVRRIVYLGGLGRESDRLSRHLRSRQEVGSILADQGVDTIELRAGVIIGSGSASFEMLRYLVEVLPVMVTPRWVSTRCQPIAIADVISYLHRAVVDTALSPGIYEVGGPDVVSYAEMMQAYAEAVGLPPRRLISVPFLSPSLSSHWVGLVTPVPVPLAKELVESLVNEVTIQDDRAATTFDVRPMSLRAAIDRATAAVRDGNVPTTFLGADLIHFAPTATDPDWAGGTSLTDVRRRTTTADAKTLFATISAIGGDKGWYSGAILWRTRGLLDKLVGGPGLRKGRKSAIAVGDSIDFWRVEALLPDRQLVLRAEMVLPGRAWLRWDIETVGTGSVITQTAELRPKGLLGRAYWLGVAPFHRFVFPGMLAGIVADAEGKMATGPNTPR